MKKGLTSQKDNGILYAEIGGREPQGGRKMRTKLDKAIKKINEQAWSECYVLSAQNLDGELCLLDAYENLGRYDFYFNEYVDEILTEFGLLYEPYCPGRLVIFEEE